MSRTARLVLLAIIIAALIIGGVRLRSPLKVVLSTEAEFTLKRTEASEVLAALGSIRIDASAILSGGVREFSYHGKKIAAEFSPTSILTLKADLSVTNSEANGGGEIRFAPSRTSATIGIAPPIKVGSGVAVALLDQIELRSVDSETTAEM